MTHFSSLEFVTVQTENKGNCIESVAATLIYILPAPFIILQ